MGNTKIKYENSFSIYNTGIPTTIVILKIKNTPDVKISPPPATTVSTIYKLALLQEEMGQFSCRGCDCRFIEGRNELELKVSVKANQDLYSSYQGYKDTMSTILTGEAILPDFEHSRTKTNLLIKIQSLIRGRIQRNRYYFLINSNTPPHPYFSRTEVFDNLSKKSSPPEFIEQRPVKIYKDGGVYEGEWCGGFRHGEGSMFWLDGSRFEGNWVWGRPFGVGKFIYHDGEVFEGNWKSYFVCISKTDIEGLGSAIWREFSQTDGYSKNETEWLAYKSILQESILISPLPSSSEPVEQIINTISQVKSTIENNTYIIQNSTTPSEFVEIGVREFKEFKFGDGSVYLGEWINGSRDGRGKNTWPDGETYEGEWKKDNEHGWGKHWWTDNSIFIGSHEENLKEGVGLYKWEEGTEYLGEWKNNQMEGVGRYKWPDGKVYLGQWMNGIMHGYGSLAWPDGKRYEGSWSIGKKHGEGISYLTNKRVSRDIWRYGKIIRPDI